VILLKSLLFAIVAIVLTACPAEETPSEPAEASSLPELAVIGGVQDVWAFEFGMDADRARVREVLGEPGRVVESGPDGSDAGPRIERFQYEGIQVDFLLDPTDGHEYLLLVRISDPSVPLSGGLRIGMPVDEAADLLGEPQIADAELQVYFYRATTIELGVSDGVVETITLARALP